MGQVEHLHRPAPLVGAVGCRFGLGLQTVAILGALEVERQRGLTGAALLRGGAIVLVGEIELERGEQEGAEAPALPIGRRQRVALEQRGEEALGQVLRRIGVGAASTHVGVDRIPVALTEVGQRLMEARVAIVAGRDHQAPLRGAELSGHLGERYRRRGRSVARTAAAKKKAEPLSRLRLWSGVVSLTD